MHQAAPEPGPDDDTEPVGDALAIAAGIAGLIGVLVLLVMAVTLVVMAVGHYG